MAQVINTNVPSLNTQRHLAKTSAALTTSLQRLSSGLRINSSKDDAAGMAISERMTAQIRGMTQAQRNSNDGVSFSQTAEGALNEMAGLLQRIRELAVQSANATNSASDRKALNDEVGQLTAELQRFAVTTEFNGTKILDGSNATSVFQVGANANQTITVTTTDFRTNQYGTYQVGNAQASGASGLGKAVSNATGGAYVSGTQIPGAAVSGTGSLVVNGPNGSGTVAVTISDSARDIAQKINAISTTGVKATAVNFTQIDFGISGNYTLEVFSSNVAGSNTVAPVAFSISDPDTAAGLSQAVNAFNEASSKTGITARLSEDSMSIILSTDDGANINIGAAVAGATTGAVFLGSDATGGTVSSIAAGLPGMMTAGGQVTLDSSRSYSIVTSAGAEFPFGTLATGAIATAATVGSDLKKVESLDVSTVPKATDALRIVDSAIDAVNSQRAKFGALQGRFEATIANLATTIENMSSSRSRIQDTDFAAETAAMTRAQVLQQAGTAMLAQANALPQSVLQLLQ